MTLEVRHHKPQDQGRKRTGLNKGIVHSGEWKLHEQSHEVREIYFWENEYDG